MSHVTDVEAVRNIGLKLIDVLLRPLQKRPQTVTSRARHKLDLQIFPCTFEDVKVARQRICTRRRHFRRRAFRIIQRFDKVLIVFV